MFARLKQLSTALIQRNISRTATSVPQNFPARSFHSTNVSAHASHRSIQSIKLPTLPHIIFAQAPNDHMTDYLLSTGLAQDLSKLGYKNFYDKVPHDFSPGEFIEYAQGIEKQYNELGSEFEKYNLDIAKRDDIEAFILRQLQDQLPMMLHANEASFKKISQSIVTMRALIDLHAKLLLKKELYQTIMDHSLCPNGYVNTSDNFLTDPPSAYDIVETFFSADKPAIGIVSPHILPEIQHLFFKTITNA